MFAYVKSVTMVYKYAKRITIALHVFLLIIDGERDVRYRKKSPFRRSQSWS